MKLRFSYIFILLPFLEIILSSPVNAAIKIMPLGASITRGSSSGEPDPDYQVSYRKALWDLLVASGYEVDFVGSLNNGLAVFGDSDLSNHEGHAGWRDDEIVEGRPGYGSLEDWLTAEHPEIVLLHIGTNGLDTSPDDVKNILDLIEDHESKYGEAVWVILPRIINRSDYSQPTTNFNDNVETLAHDRIDNPGNPAYPDKIIIVDMEDGANIDYNLVTDDPPGDMWDNLHPFETGYKKMAEVWFLGLQAILPVADAGSKQNDYEGNTVTLNASHSLDPDGIIVSYFWEQQPGGSRVILSDLMAAKPTFAAPDVGSNGETLTFKVTVTDADGLESTDITKVDVLDDNCPNDPDKTEPGVCGCGVTDIDTDGDSILDCIDTNDDNDGLLDEEEQGPGGNDPSYDGNSDGIADMLQSNVASFPIYDNQKYITMESPVGTTISKSQAVDIPSPDDATYDVEFSYGFLEITVNGISNGGTTTVVLYFPVGTSFDTYYKYGPTPSNDIDHWYEFLYDGQTGAEMDGHVITLHFVDGQRGDDDLTADGLVFDVGGPGITLDSNDGDGNNDKGGEGGGGCFIGTAVRSYRMVEE